MNQIEYTETIQDESCTIAHEGKETRGMADELTLIERFWTQGIFVVGIIVLAVRDFDLTRRNKEAISVIVDRQEKQEQELYDIRNTGTTAIDCEKSREEVRIQLVKEISHFNQLHNQDIAVLAKGLEVLNKSFIEYCKEERAFKASQLEYREQRAADDAKRAADEAQWRANMLNAMPGHNK